MGLTKWFDRNITDMANDNYYDIPHNPELDGASEAELEAYVEYCDNGGEMTFEQWQKYIKETE